LLPFAEELWECKEFVALWFSFFYCKLSIKNTKNFIYRINILIVYVKEKIKNWYFYLLYILYQFIW
jgi:hypothetical protein